VSDTDEPIETDEDTDTPCWCGVENPYYSDDLPETCGGTGILVCHCGGDQCVCHWHGEVDCDGCADCEEAGDDDCDDYPNEDPDDA
jgi:hypothetical protein